MANTRGPRKRRDLRIWAAALFFVGASAFLLFAAQPLFFQRTGVKAVLLKKAGGLKGGPRAEVVREVGRILKAYLDAAKPSHRAETAIGEASSERLVLRILLSPAETSPRKHRERGRTTARLAAGMLARAGAGDVSVVVELRRRRASGRRESEPLGHYAYDPAARKYAWQPAP